MFGILFSSPFLRVVLFLSSFFMGVYFLQGVCYYVFNVLRLSKLLIVWSGSQVVKGVVKVTQVAAVFVLKRLSGLNAYSGMVLFMIISLFLLSVVKTFITS